MSFGIMSLGLMSFGVMSFGLLSVYRERTVRYAEETSVQIILLYMRWLVVEKKRLLMVERERRRVGKGQKIERKR